MIQLLQLFPMPLKKPGAFVVTQPVSHETVSADCNLKFLRSKKGLVKKPQTLIHITTSYTQKSCEISGIFFFDLEIHLVMPFIDLVQSLPVQFLVFGLVFILILLFV